jgi:hypothetical protein
MFFSVSNHSPTIEAKAVTLIEKPWEYKMVARVTQQIRHDKNNRQSWYQDPETRHCFYSGVEGINPNIRVSAENPPHMLHAIIADYDTVLSDERIDEAIVNLKVKPAWVEKSFSGHCRLVWPLVRPLPVDSMEFFKYVMAQANEWLELETLPMLDVSAMTTATRYYCNGCEWRATGHPDVTARQMQSFYVDCGAKFSYRPVGLDGTIPLDKVEEALKKRYPSFNWPSDFAVKSQGPSFWIEGSTSPLSAIVKDGGMFSYAAHASKPFHSWSDLLGEGFSSEYSKSAIAAATEGIFTDGKEFYHNFTGSYKFDSMVMLKTILKVNRGVTEKAGPDGKSMMDKVLTHVGTYGRVDAIAPHAFYPTGLLHLSHGRKELNIYSGKMIEPATEGTQKWGPQGNFPFWSAVLDHLFDPHDIQLAHFLASYSYAYNSALAHAPLPGQLSIFAGERGNGKTLVNRELIGYSYGGYADCSRFLIKGEDFTAHLFEYGYWVCDDETSGDNERAQQRIRTAMKTIVANSTQTYHKKFGLPSQVKFEGRVGITANLDYLSTRVISVDGHALDKLNLYRCNQVPDSFKFPTRPEIRRIRDAETPYFLRFLADYKVPDFLGTNTRFGLDSFQETSLLQNVQQTSASAPFCELLIVALEHYFQANPEASVWKGPVTEVQRLIQTDPGRQFQFDHSSLNLNAVHRALERVEREKLLECSRETGRHNFRLYVFKRPAELPAPQPPQPPQSTPDAPLPFNPFEKK